MSIEVRNSPIHGKGVFTTASVTRHGVIGRVGITRFITEKAPLDESKGERPYHIQYYADGRQALLAEPFRYLNHCCEPNAFYYTVNGVSYVLAMRDIEAGEEITLDYSLCHIGGQVWECRCGLPGCRSTHRAGFRHLPSGDQQRYLPYLDPDIVSHHEPEIRGIIEAMMVNGHQD